MMNTIICTIPYIYLIKYRKNGYLLVLSPDIDLPPDYPFDFTKHLIAILPTADTLEDGKRLNMMMPNEIINYKKNMILTILGL